MDSSGWVSPFLSSTCPSLCFRILFLFVACFFLDYYRYYSYTVIYWLVFVFVWLSLGNAILVGYGFHNESARFVSLCILSAHLFANNTLKGKKIWPIRTLRWFTSVLVSALYIPVVVVLLISLSCTSPNGVLTTFKGSNVQCWGADNAVKAVASVITLLAFTPFAIANSVTYYESDPTIKTTYLFC